MLHPPTSTGPPNPLPSILENRATIDGALRALDHDSFSSPAYNNLGWVWQAAWWKQAEEVADLLKPVCAYIHEVESDSCTLSEALEKYLPMRAALHAASEGLQKAPKERLQTALTNRDLLLKTILASACNLLDHRFRGGRLLPDEKRKAMTFITSELCPFLKLEPPPVQVMVDFIGKIGIFAESDGWSKISPRSFWKCVFSDTPISKVGFALASIVASTGSIERVWSAAKWQGEDRERLSANHLANEVYIRWNCRAIANK